jgi:hypothetical protein
LKICPDGTRSRDDRTTSLELKMLRGQPSIFRFFLDFAAIA